jgi:Na+-transporting NADH:ubiquinone oxidoreductase subunit A
VLARISENKVHLNVSTATKATEFLQCKNVIINTFSGPHPAGNPGIQIHHLDPINKGEVVWVVGVQEVIAIGRLFNQGRYNPEIIIALAGSEVITPGYYKSHRCASVYEILKGNVIEGNNRYISGNVLTGTHIRPDNYLNFYDSMITVIPEGDQHEFLGWAMPGLNKFSISRSFFSWLSPRRKYVLDSNMHGGERAYVMTGLYEKVLPMDIYPMQLIKAILFEDIDLMENLGIYEVEPEDFALCEFVDVSKSEIQTIIRSGLELMRKEMS